MTKEHLFTTPFQSLSEYDKIFIQRLIYKNPSILLRVKLPSYELCEKALIYSEMVPVRPEGKLDTSHLTYASYVSLCKLEAIYQSHLIDIDPKKMLYEDYLQVCLTMKSFDEKMVCHLSNTDYHFLCDKWLDISLDTYGKMSEKMQEIYKHRYDFLRELVERSDKESLNLKSSGLVEFT